MKNIFAVLLASAFISPLFAEKPLYIPKIIGHRGFAAAAPENTIASLKLGWQDNSADALEIDLRRTADGEIILLHDQNLHRTSNTLSPKTPVAEMTLEDIRKYEVGSWKDEKFKGEKVPTLDEVFAILPAGKSLILEIKNCGPNFHTVLKEKMTKYKISDKQIFVIAFDVATLSAIEKNLPELNTFLLIDIGEIKSKKIPRTSAKNLIALMQKHNFDGADIKISRYLDSAYIDKVKKAGFILGIYTVNNAETARKYADYGVDFITTDNPPLVKKAINGN